MESHQLFTFSTPVISFAPLCSKTYHMKADLCTILLIFSLLIVTQSTPRQSLFRRLRDYLILYHAKFPKAMSDDSDQRSEI
jgi:hypothetical protein